MQPSGGSARLQVSGSLGAEDPSGVQGLGRGKDDHCHGPGPPALPLLSLSAPESPHASSSEGTHGQEPPWPLDPPRKSRVSIYWTVTDHSKYVQIRPAHGLGLPPSQPALSPTIHTLPLPGRERQPLGQGQLSTLHLPVSLLRPWAPRRDLASSR